MRGSRIDVASRVIAAPPGAIYTAFLDPDALMCWLPPEGMTGRLEAFEPRAGGIYRMVLSYDSADHATPGKTTAHADVVQGTFVELIPDERIVWQVEFESDAPAFAGTMTMTWSLAARPEGTEVTIRCEDVPEGIRKEDHDAGLRSTLSNLAAFTQRRAGREPPVP